MSPTLHRVPARSLASRSYENEDALLQRQSLLMEARSHTDDGIPVRPTRVTAQSGPLPCP